MTAALLYREMSPISCERNRHKKKERWMASWVGHHLIARSTHTQTHTVDPIQFIREQFKNYLFLFCVFEIWRKRLNDFLTFLFFSPRCLHSFFGMGTCLASAHSSSSYLYPYYIYIYIIYLTGCVLLLPCKVKQIKQVINLWVFAVALSLDRRQRRQCIYIYRVMSLRQSSLPSFPIHFYFFFSFRRPQ